MGVASGCGEQEVGVASGSGWNLWVWLLGVVLRRYIDFLILLIPTPLVSVLFYRASPLFCSFLKMFFVLLYYTVHRVLDYGQLPIWACHRCTPCRSLSFLANAYTESARSFIKINAC